MNHPNHVYGASLAGRFICNFTNYQLSNILNY
jgi:hypothetical protein